MFAVAIVLVPAMAQGAELKAVRDYTLQKGDAVASDLYVAAQTNVVAGEVSGDLAAAGANMLLTGSVEGDLFAAGGTVELLGVVGDDVRVVGGTITIGNAVGGDVVAAGGVLHIISGATVAGDVIVAGGQVIIDGTVQGSVKVAAGEVTINGTVGKDVSVRSDKQFSIGRSAKIDGNLWYKAADAVIVAEGAVIQGETKFEKVERPTRVDKRAGAAMVAMVGAVALLKLIAAMLIAVLGVTLFRKGIQSLTKTVADNFGKEMVRGFVVLIVCPAAIILAFMSIIGIGLGIAGILLYTLLIMAAKVLAGIIVGTVLVKMIKKASAYEVNWQNAVIGVFVFQVVGMIPIVGWLFAFLLLIASLGSISMMLYQKVWLKR